jgi:flagellar capping protein FliD
MTEMEKQLLSALESLQTSYEQQQQAWQDSYSSLQHMFETTSQALTQRQGVSALEQSGERLREQVERLSSDRQPLNALVKQHERQYSRRQASRPHQKPTRTMAQKAAFRAVKCTLYIKIYRRQP